MTSFKPGVKRSAASIAAQRRTILLLIAKGKWNTQLPEVAAKLRGPNPKKGFKGDRNHKWRPVGSKALGAGGHYIKVKIAEPNIWEYEHRIVAEEKIGRRLEKGEEVHHLNGDKLDNRADNLVVMTRSDHAAVKQHGYPRCPTCGYKHPPH